jgi:hypothetical protein
MIRLASASAPILQRKDRFATGQQANTQANATISRVQKYGSVGKYCAACKALQQLAPQLQKDNAWVASFPELHDKDIRAMTFGLDGESERRRSLLWIWKHKGVAGDSDNLHECTCP